VTVVQGRQSGQRMQDGGLAGAIGAEDGDDLAGHRAQRDVDDQVAATHDDVGLEEVVPVTLVCR
jgi:hypothetical protein